MKKCLCLLMALVLTAATMPALAQEEQAKTFENFIYKINDEKTVTITGLVDNTVTEIVIPEKIEERGVTVGDYAFRDCVNLETANVKAISKLPEGVFLNCTSLKNVYLAENNFEIGESAFENCTSLKCVNLENTKTIHPKAFRGCVLLEEVYFVHGYNNQYIGNSAFENCVSLKYIDLYKAVSLGEGAFYNCTSLEFVYLSYLQEFQGAPFEKCTALKHAFVTGLRTFLEDEENKSKLFYGANSDLNIFWGAELYKNQKANAYTISEENGIKKMNVTGYIQGTSDKANMDDYFKSYNIYKDVDVVVIDETVQRVGEKAFANMPALKEVIIKSPVVVLGSNAFYNCDNLEKITFPEYGKIDMWGSVFGDCDKLKDVEFKPSVFDLGGDSFAACDNLEKITFPESGMLKIHRDDFASCNKLTEIRLAGGISSIDGEAFKNCENITKIIIGKDFDDSILGPTWRYTADFLANIFNNIPSIQTIEVEEGNRFYKVVDNVLYDYPMKNLYRYVPNKPEKEFTIPDGVEYIRNGAFKGEKNLDVVNVAGSVKEIDTYSFGGVSLYKLNIHEGVKKIYGHAFLNSNIENLVIPESMESLYSYPYRPSPKTSTTAYVLHGGVKNLHYRGSEARLDLWNNTDYVDGVNAFYNYTDNEPEGENVYEFKDYTYLLTGAKNINAETVTIPSHINGYPVTISNGAFGNMPNLKTVKLEEGVLKIPCDTFKNSTNLSHINLENVEFIGKDAFLGTRLESVSLLNIKEWESGFENIETLKEAYVKFPYAKTQTPLFKNLTNLEKVYLINVNDFINEEEFSNCGKVTVYTDLAKAREYFELKGIKTQKGTIECEYSKEEILKGEKFKFLGGVYQYKNDTLYYLYPVRNDEEIYIPAIISGFKVKLKDKVLNKNPYVRRVHLSEDIKEISNNAFSDCTLLEYINLENIEKLGEAAFTNCDSLTEITLLNVNYWHGARYYDVDLVSMKAPYYIYTFSRQPFTKCDNLTKMTIKWPENYLGNDTFAEQDSSGGYMQELIPGTVKELHMLNAPKTINPNEFISLWVVVNGKDGGVVDHYGKKDVTIYSTSSSVERYAKQMGLNFVKAN